MILKLAVLIISAIILFAVLNYGGKGGGVGGGSYDLSEMVYGGLFILFIVFWNIWVIISLITSKIDLDRQHNIILLIVGVIALISAVVWYIKLLF